MEFIHRREVYSPQGTQRNAEKQLDLDRRRANPEHPTERTLLFESSWKRERTLCVPCVLCGEEAIDSGEEVSIAMKEAIETP
jgi:hypothetical protein